MNQNLVGLSSPLNTLDYPLSTTSSASSPSLASSSSLGFGARFDPLDFFHHSGIPPLPVQSAHSQFVQSLAGTNPHSALNTHTEVVNQPNFPWRPISFEQVDHVANLIYALTSELIENAARAFVPSHAPVDTFDIFKPAEPVEFVDPPLKHREWRLENPEITKPGFQEHGIAIGLDEDWCDQAEICDTFH